MNRTIIVQDAGSEHFTLPLRVFTGRESLASVTLLRCVVRDSDRTHCASRPYGRRRRVSPQAEDRSRRANAFRQRARPLDHHADGFTLVELLTVIAIIAVLATLLMTSLGAAKKKSRQTVCTGNLRQISLALNMYLDDFAKRPSGFESLVSERFLPSRGSFLCPEDKTRNWGGIIQSRAPSGQASSDSPPAVAASPSPQVFYSYLHPLPWDDASWNTLTEQGSSAGIAACQLHGLGKQDFENPSIYNFEGLVLRAQRDTAVVRRQIYWDQPASTEFRAATFAALPTAAASIPEYPWRFFTDQPPVNDANPVVPP